MSYFLFRSIHQLPVFVWIWFAGPKIHFFLVKDFLPRWQIPCLSWLKLNSASWKTTCIVIWGERRRREGIFVRLQPCGRRIPDLNLSWGFSLWSLHALPVLHGVSTSIPAFYFTLDTSMLSCERAWLFLICLRGHLIDEDWPCLLPDDSRDGPQPSRDPKWDN